MGNRAYLLLPVFVACLIFLAEAAPVVTEKALLSEAFERPERILTRHKSPQRDPPAAGANDVSGGADSGAGGSSADAASADSAESAPNMRATSSKSADSLRKSRDHSGGRNDNSGGRNDHSGGHNDHSGGRNDHSGGRNGDHSDGRNDHSGGRNDHSGGRNDHSGGRNEHSGGRNDHSGRRNRGGSSSGCPSSTSGCAITFNGHQGGGIPWFPLPQQPSDSFKDLIVGGPLELVSSVKVEWLNSNGAQYPCSNSGTANLENQFYATGNVSAKPQSQPLPQLLSPPCLDATSCFRSPPSQPNTALHSAFALVVLLLVARGSFKLISIDLLPPSPAPPPLPLPQVIKMRVVQPGDRGKLRNLVVKVPITDGVLKLPPPLTHPLPPHFPLHSSPPLSPAAPI
ncbi:unnamed protein product [Closterium sp. Naga37s-1]|nr:unnamed protein product [Closterium sp. Naga37s-1]